MTPRHARVSVVIPTMNTRAALHDAVASALAQRDVEVEVVVAMNGRGESPEFADPRVRVVRSDPADRGNGARMAGIRAARHELIALLDDDDSWVPHKLRDQLEAVRERAGADDNWLMSCAITELDTLTGETRIVPTEPVLSVLSISYYLLARPRLRSVSPQFASSTMLFPRALALREPWDTSVRLHQDWEWLVRLEANRGTRMLCVPDPLVQRPVSHSDSLTTAPDWRSSLEWGKRHLMDHSARIRGDFFLTIPADRAGRAASAAGLLACASAAIRHGRAGYGAWAYFGVTVVRAARNGLRRVGTSS
ncbi:glycosyltransferase [Leifsonia shinshuensis]|uniref:glycosyltransferase family 2 protein n=1 Tax=Leifsonia shinshuensis TaxID=150026 RepID=UPI001F51163E|nr:glycosyltransferase family 2 protein [Leifsonia shinshuensis]MCI0159088.1 glycosyltransferase [Leifsonia shinshuensis]